VLPLPIVTASIESWQVTMTLSINSTNPAYEWGWRCDGKLVNNIILCAVSPLSDPKPRYGAWVAYLTKDLVGLIRNHRCRSDFQSISRLDTRNLYRQNKLTCVRDFNNAASRYLTSHFYCPSASTGGSGSCPRKDSSCLIESSCEFWTGACTILV